MKRVGFLIEDIADMDNLLLAFYKAQRGKQAKKEVVLYRECLQDNLLDMQKQILSGEVNVGSYHTFTIYDPKRRLICASCFEERVLHHALMNVCHPYFERQLIFHTYATRIGKGTYAALKQAHKYTIKYSYVAKLDVKRYFDSINHNILCRQLSRMFKDKILLNIFQKIIDTYETTEYCGLPIGNLTSQYFANQYLSCFDHYIMEEMQAEAYIRYMDDMLIFSNDRQDLVRQVKEVEKYIKEQLNLKLKSPIITSTKQGVCFLGYKLKGWTIRLTSRSRNRFSHKMNLYYKLLNQNLWTEKDYYTHVSTLISFTQHAYTKSLRRRIIHKVENRRAPTESNAVALGTTTRGTAVFPIATTTIRRTGTITSASASPSSVSLAMSDGIGKLNRFSSGVCNVQNKTNEMFFVARSNCSKFSEAFTSF